MPAVTEDLAAMTNAERRAMGYNPAARVPA